MQLVSRVAIGAVLVGVFSTWTEVGSVTLNGTQGPNNGWLVVILERCRQDRGLGTEDRRAELLGPEGERRRSAHAKTTRAARAATSGDAEKPSSATGHPATRPPSGTRPGRNRAR
jgi:hypothetical protein